MPGAGDFCKCCQEIKAKGNSRHEIQRLIVVNGALVCPHCDSVPQWPSQRGPGSRPPSLR